MHYCTVNGQAANQIEITDRGLAYGDGIFTTGKILDGKVNLLVEHIERLKSYCHCLSITNVDFLVVEQELIEASSKFELAVVKVLISAGSGGRGYSRIGANKPTVIITIHDFPEHYKSWKNNGISLGHSSITLGVNPLLAGIKHLNRLEQVLIRKELDSSEFDDVLVFDINNQLIEASAANVFLFQNEQWYTPVLATAGVNGLARQQIMKNFDIIEAEIDQDFLMQTEQIFICNSVMGIVPINQYNSRNLSISAVQRIQSQLTL